VDEYIERALFKPQEWKENPQLRTIPIGESISNPAEILPYEQAEKLIQAYDKFAVAECICRKEKQMVGEGCDKPLETCLVMGQNAEFYERYRKGRPIDKVEALGILTLADEHGLVIQPANSKDAGYICFCCGDCCGVLRTIKQYPQPGTLVSSPYFAVSDEEVCSACETCVERCQMDAIQVNGHAQVLRERCIGCGLCVTTCDTGAMQLERKPEHEQPYVPKDIQENFLRLARQRGTIKTPDLVKMAIRSKVDRLLAPR
jgi:Fe-S-cluster-containing hydrogenase component 2